VRDASGVTDAFRVDALAIRDWRNLASVAVALPPEGLVVVGDNGHGKTNFLEAVYALQLLRPARGGRDLDAVRFGADGWHVRATGTFRGARELALGFERARRRKKVVVDGAEVPRLGDALGHLPSVYLAPDDQRLVAGPPTERRRFLDIVLALTSRPYLQALTHYRAALARRNAALRSAPRDPQAEGHAAVWEPTLARYGAVLWAARAAWVAAHADAYAATCTAIGERGAAALALAVPGGRDGRDEASLLGQLERQRAHDLRRGQTHAGPHRDDLELTLDGRELRTFGSAGQQRTAAFALRLLEAATWRDATGAAPLLLLDDPFAELDEGRAHRILQLLATGGRGQVLLCVPRAGDVPPALTALARASMRDGTLTLA
jgi:DNA replication and repair protein RecF